MRLGAPVQARDFVCIPKSLPTIDDKVAAAKRAVEINPLNAPRRRGLIAMGIMHPQSIALLTDKYWGPKGVDLAVQFLDTNNTTLQNKILAYMNKWNKFGNIKFRLVKSNGQVRIAIQGDGYWSYVGTDILGIPLSQPTMTLQDFSLSTPDSEYDRVVCHETGHTCGFPHEHERKDVLNLLDVEKTVAWFRTNVGWDRQTVMEQVFSPLDPNSIRASAPDTRSIMCYSFPGACTKNGQPIPGGNVIDSIDGVFVGSIYPLVDAPPPPPPPPPPPTGNPTATMPEGFGVTVGGLTAWTNGGEVNSSAQGTCSVRVIKKASADMPAAAPREYPIMGGFNEHPASGEPSEEISNFFGKQDELSVVHHAMPHPHYAIPLGLWTWLYAIGSRLIPYVIEHAPTVVPIIVRDIRAGKTIEEIETDVKNSLLSL